MSCRKNCKKWRHELFKSFKIFFCAVRNSGEYVEDRPCSPEEIVNVQLGRRAVLCELESKLLEYCIIMEQRYCLIYKGWIQSSGNTAVT